ncbi:MAG TPA: DNA repair protein RecN [Candidatus Polarisedimenticolia bacterium]|jgi:DNA repair protein RecN (Recombination protein N)|nr:DNA repair protein RecN [Candidatus Polarisedimenticolia bacterium]
MIRYLRIRNLAIIREISFEISPGFTVITGETGAGKSILVDSLALLMGERCGADRIRAGEESASAEAVFDVSRQEALRPFLEERGWEPEEGEMILRREIQSGGKSRSFVGSRLASLADLKSLGERLVDLHGQHDHQTLLRTAEQLPLLDRFCDHGAALGEIRAPWEEIRRLRARLETLRQDRLELARRVEMLRFQAEEIDRAAVVPGEIERLKRERGLVRNQEKIRQLALTALDRLYEGEGAALPGLDGALSSARELARLDPEMAGALGRAEEARPALAELAQALREAGRERESDPSRLEAIESRLASLESLARKYGSDEAAILEFGKRAKDELEELLSPEGSEEGLERKLAEAAADFAARAAALSSGRRRGGRLLEKEVKRQLSELGMEGTEFRVDSEITPDPGSPVLRDGEAVRFDSAGYDRVDFRISTNPGEPPRPLARVASGGELSRIMLAVHLVLRGAADETVRVFDEVDAGIGGRVAEAVGRKLRKLSQGGQVLCVTHLPQIASMADHHLVVSKKVIQGRTEVRVDELDRKGSVREVARMLGGERISDLTLRHAEEMVARGR